MHTVHLHRLFPTIIRTIVVLVLMRCCSHTLLPPHWTRRRPSVRLLQNLFEWLKPIWLACDMLNSDTCLLADFWIITPVRNMSFKWPSPWCAAKTAIAWSCRHFLAGKRTWRSRVWSWYRDTTMAWPWELNVVTRPIQADFTTRLEVCMYAWASLYWRLRCLLRTRRAWNYLSMTLFTKICARASIHRCFTRSNSTCNVPKIGDRGMNFEVYRPILWRNER